MPERNPTVSLVLGSGGARGLAHIGVIRCLEELGFRVKSVSGSSMGALIGGVYVLGKLDEFEKRVRAVTRVDMVSLVDISLRGGGLMRGDKIIDALRNFLGDADIEDLPVRFTAVATDLNEEKEVWITSGSLFDAIRASISLPIFFTPAEIRGVRLVDGGVLNPVPIAPTFRDNTDLTIAVNLNGPRTGETRRRPSLPDRDETLLTEFRGQIREFIRKFGSESPKGGLRERRFHEIVGQSFETMQSTIARYKLAAYPPDVLIEISRDACRMLEFDLATEMVALGYSKAQEAIESTEG